jgi:hypothetical protein
MEEVFGPRVGDHDEKQSTEEVTNGRLPAVAKDDQMEPSHEQKQDQQDGEAFTEERGFVESKTSDSTTVLEQKCNDGHEAPQREADKDEMDQ